MYVFRRSPFPFFPCLLMPEVLFYSPASLLSLFTNENLNVISYDVVVYEFGNWLPGRFLGFFFLYVRSVLITAWVYYAYLVILLIVYSRDFYFETLKSYEWT